MKIDIFDIKEFIDINHLTEITSPILFQRGVVPDPEGLVSNQIFGVTINSRKSTFAYIDLQGYFFHPHVYKAIRRMFRNIDRIISGDQYYSIVDGKLVLDANNGETGIDFLYNNWDKIEWEKSEVQGMRNERVDLLRNLKKNEIFMHYLIVIPPFYRDIRTSSSGGGETGKLNKLYQSAIRYASLLKDRTMFDFQFNNTNLNMQNLLVSVYDYFKTKLEKKTGMLRRYLLGKNIDYCTRTVITAPKYNTDKPSDLMTDFRHAAIPISQICSLCNPYIFKWVKDFFERELFSQKESILIYDPITDKGIQAKLINPESIFTDKWIKKMIDTFYRDPGSRFNKIEVPVANSKTKYYMQFTGRRLDATNTSEISNIAFRPLTWTDILYQAACEVTKGKHCMVTRYPLLDEFGIFISRINVSSTVKTEPVMINGQIYKWYPVIEFDTEENQMASKFVDSVRFSNSYLPGLVGDYDGDQTTMKILFTLEANEECERIMNSKSFFISANGKMIRTVECEPIQTFYTMTKEPTEKDRVLTDNETKRFLDLKPEDISFKYLVSIFGNTTSIRNGQSTEFKISDYNCTDIININTPYMGFTGKTTLGRLIYNKVIYEQCGFEKIIGYINEPVTDGVYGRIENIIATSIKKDEIPIDNMYKYIDCRDWLGLQLHPIVTASFTPTTLKRPKEVTELQKQLQEKYKDELENNNARVSEIIENELIKKTKEVLKDDVGMDLYDSGARGSIGNNFKNMYLSRGAIKNSQTGGYDIIKGSMTDGLEKKDIAAHSNSILAGAYPKAVGTAESGYMAKELMSSLQSEILGEPGSDCGTTKTIKVVIPKKSDAYVYRYIIENGKLVCLTPEIIAQYVGKEVQMRSPLYCTAEHLCSKCAGEDFYKLGKRAIGLSASRVATTCTNLNMKKFHENLVKFHKIDLNDMFI